MYCLNGFLLQLGKREDDARRPLSLPLRQPRPRTASVSVEAQLSRIGTLNWHSLVAKLSRKGEPCVLMNPTRETLVIAPPNSGSGSLLSGVLCASRRTRIFRQKHLPAVHSRNFIAVRVTSVSLHHGQRSNSKIFLRASSYKYGKEFSGALIV